MRRPEKDTDEPLLFDLPLEPPERSSERNPQPEPAERRRAAVPPAPPARPAPERSAPPQREEALLPEAELEVSEEEADAEPAARTLGLGTRFASGVADLLVHAAVLIVLLVGTRLMGVRPALADWPAFAAFLAAFSFLYLVVPLAFWGHTLGMAWAGLLARNADGEPLTFDQTARRWLGAGLTVLLLGLPLLLFGPRRTLADRISGSETYLSGAS